MFPLVNFWNHVIADAPAVADAAAAELPFTREKWRAWVDEMESLNYLTEGVVWAARFWSMRTGGSPMRPLSFSPVVAERFNRQTRTRLKKLRRFRAHGLTVVHRDYEAFLSEFDGFVYCDPPYVASEDVYNYKKGIPVFDHPRLAEILKARKGWILSYNDCPLVRELYAGYDIQAVKVYWATGTMLGKSTEATELIIADRGE